MGKGDKKTKKGKIIQGSYGVKRPRKPVSAYVPGSVAPRSAAVPKVAKSTEISDEALAAKAKKKAAKKGEAAIEPEVDLIVQNPPEADVLVEPVAAEEAPELNPEA